MRRANQYRQTNTPKGLRPETDLSKWIWLVPGIALIVAVLPMPYVYYIGLRWLVCGAALLLSWKEYEAFGRRGNGFAVVFGAVAVVYNPILPVHLFKLLWIMLNLLGAAVFFGHYRLCVRGRK